MKRTLLLLCVLAALVGAYFMVGQKENSGKTSIQIEDRDFILKDKSAVGTITIKSTGRPLIHLSKTSAGWLINNKLKANHRIVDNMLMALNTMSIQYIPSKLENETALNRMQIHGLDIKTYDVNGNIITDFILGTNTNTEYGTYCRKADANQTYVMSLSVVEGGIRNYFTQSVQDLRDMTIFSFDAEDLEGVTIEYPKNEKNSFSIYKDGSTLKFEAINQLTEKKANQNVMDAFLHDFIDLQSMFVKNDHVFKDTILTYLPFMEMTVESSDAPKFTMDVYPINDLENSQINTRSVDDLTPQHERYFVHTNGGDFYMVQHQFLRKFLKKVDYFYDESVN